MNIKAYYASLRLSAAILTPTIYARCKNASNIDPASLTGRRSSPAKRQVKIETPVK